jgi:N-methylhydantoinase A
MLIGLDVGGTYTDAVLLDAGRVLEKKKVPTDPEDLLKSLLGALSPLLKKAGNKPVERIVLSTTLITNLIATHNIDPVALVLIPGPGLNPQNYHFGVPDTFILSGAIDYRGREIEPLRDEELKKYLQQIKKVGIKRLAVVGKFSQRNHKHEDAAAAFFHSGMPGLQIVTGHQVSGRLNYPRRVVTTLLTLATQDRFHDFYTQVQAALAEKGVSAPLYILKADGGTLPFEQSLDKPVETIFSGPAASTLGVMALTPGEQTSVVLDIGGTTTDLALILSGKPLLASRGAKIGDALTHVRSFATNSVALGGDSRIEVRDGRLLICPQRMGPAFCLGGPVPTPTDAMRLAGCTEIGDLKMARQAMQLLADGLHQSPEEAAQAVLKQMVKMIAGEIDSMFRSWEQEPAYRIWEFHQRQKIRPQNVVGIGAAAAAVLPLLGQQMGCRAITPPYADVANAVGAALARINLRLTFHFDTERNFYFIEENGVQEKLKHTKPSPAEAERFCFERLESEGCKLGIDAAEKPELVYSEMFNMVRGWSTTGRLYDICVQFPSGIMENWLERDDSSGS